MSANDIVLVILSGLGVIHGIFLAVFLFFYKKGNVISNRLLAALLVVFSFRVGKSVFLEFSEIDIKLIFVGLASLLAIGPLFLFYVKSCCEKTFSLKKTSLLHFTPMVIGLAFGFWIEDHHYKTLPIWVFLIAFLSYYLHYITYTLVAYRYLKRKKNDVAPDVYNFLKFLFYGLLIIWFAYVLNLFDDLVPYIIGPILYSLVAYVISFIVIQKGYIKKIDHSKYKTTPLTEDQVLSIYSQIVNFVEKDKQYLNPDLSLKLISEQLHLTTQSVSMVINQVSKQNYNSFINSYRIKEAQMLFGNINYQHMTISAIAYEVGFNSISSFNSAFKKHTGKTPKNYRDELLK